EVPAPWAGVISALHGKPGDTIATGAPLVDFQAEGSSRTPDDQITVAAAPAAVVTAPAAEVATSSSCGTTRGGVVGHMPETTEVLGSTSHAGGRPSGARRNRVVPAARELARRLNIDVESVQ